MPAGPSSTIDPGSFRRVALIGRFATPGIAVPLTRLAEFLASRGHSVVLDPETARYTPLPGYRTADPETFADRVDVAIVVGGDGTMLSIARRLAPFDIPLIGINQGRLGFLTDIPLVRMEDAVGEILGGKYVEEQRTLLQASVQHVDGTEDTALAFNEIVMSRGTLGGMIDIAVQIDGRFAYAMRSDGLIVATATGSTAYALSAQGPIVHPNVPAVLLVPVAPHALSNRPIVVPDSATIAMTLQRGKDAAIHCDGQEHFPVQEGDQAIVCRAAHAVRLLHPEGHDHFAMLREKLHWAAMPEPVLRN